MDQDEHDRRLSRISTIWSDLFQAHAGEAGVIGMAQQRLLRHYTPAIYSDLVGSVRDPDVATELFQEFALKFVRGDFRRADPRRGRFRDFLKTSLSHRIAGHRRRQRGTPSTLTAGLPEPAAPTEAEADPDQQFLEHWRDELMEGTWEALRRYELETG